MGERVGGWGGVGGGILGNRIVSSSSISHHSPSKNNRHDKRVGARALKLYDIDAV